MDITTENDEQEKSTGSHPHPLADPSDEANSEASASFEADRLADRWSFGEPRRPGETVSGTINRFSPRDVPDDVWHRIEPVVKEVVAKAAGDSPLFAEQLLSIVTQLALWADRIGHSIDPGSLFTQEFIDRFVTEGCAHLSNGTRLNYRSQLWKIGTVVAGQDLFPPRSVPLKRSDLSDPYSHDEVVGLVSWSRGLSTEHMRRNCRVLLALGLGAGLKTQEVTRLVGMDVKHDGGDALIPVLGNGGQVDRTVPVHHLWGDEVLQLAEESGEKPLFLPDRRRIARGNVPNFIQKCSGQGLPKFNLQRLRITWIVGHLAAGTHLSALVQASGVAAIQLVKYLEYLGPIDEADARRMMVGRD